MNYSKNFIGSENCVSQKNKNILGNLSRNFQENPISTTKIWKQNLVTLLR
jgi:hypothetical protein